MYTFIFKISRRTKVKLQLSKKDFGQFSKHLVFQLSVLFFKNVNNAKSFFLVIVHFDGSRNWSLSVDPDFYTKNLPLFQANLNYQVHCNGSRFWVHTCNPVFLKNQVHVYGSKFWVHICSPIFLKNQVHVCGSKFWVHTCNPVFLKNQVHIYGSKFF